MASHYFFKAHPAYPCEPLFWFDASRGVSDDLSTWQARVGTYAATQPVPALRFTRGAKPNWLYSPTLQHGMALPILPMAGKTTLTVLVVVQADQTHRTDTGQTILSGGDLTLYFYNGNVECFLSDRGSAGNNPTSGVYEGQPMVVGGDAQCFVTPGSRSFTDERVGTGSNRTGSLQAPFKDAPYYIGSTSAGLLGAYRHVVFFDYQLTEAQRLAWVQLLRRPENLA